MSERTVPIRRFNPYPAYKDSGVEWLGTIPAHWEVKRLKHLATLNPESLPEDTDPAREMVYVDIGSVDDLGRIAERQQLTFATSPSRARRLVRDGDVIVSTVRTYLRAIAPISDPQAEMVVSTGFAVVRPDGDLTTGYVGYALRAPYFVERVVANSKGVSFPAINESEMATYEVPTPPKSEQRAIAAFLDRETARIDTLVASKERLIELLLEKRTAVISAVVTGKMQVGRNGGNDKEEGGRRKEDRSDSSFRLQPSSFPMKDSGVESLGEIPAHWEVKRIRHVVNSIEQGWSPDCENRETDWDEWGVLKAGCVNRGVFVETEHKALPTDLKPISELEIHEGDLLMSRASGSRDLVGSVAIVPKCRPRLLLCDKIFRLRLDADQANKPFLAYSMNSPMARWQVEVALSGGSGLANNIAQGLVKDLAVAVPTIDEQRAIATFLDQEIARLDALVAKIRDAIDRLKELRTALISAAVTGKIDVRKDEG